MKYILKFPGGPAYDYTLDEIRKEFRDGKLPENCTVRENGSQQTQTLRQLLEGTGDLNPMTEADVQARATGKGQDVADRAVARYRDGYLVARATNGIGGVVKTLGFVLGGIIALAGFVFGSLDSGSPVLMFAGFILGAVVAIPLFVLGVLVSAHGQVLKATLDEAVHTSPFLTDQQRASVMSLQ